MSLCQTESDQELRRRRTPPEPQAEQFELTLILQALADPVRLAIVRFIADNEERPCKACACPNIPKSTLAHHFKVLRQAGLIRSRELGTELRNSIRRADLEQRFPGLLAAILIAANQPAMSGQTEAPAQTNVAELA